MATAIRVEAAVPGRKRAGTAEHPLALPFAEGARLALRELVDAVVRAEVRAFRNKAEENSLLRVLTERQIAEGVDAGVIRSGETETATEVDEDAAVDAALLAFTDGLFSILVDDDPLESLDEVVVITPHTRLLFLRLVALAGG